MSAAKYDLVVIGSGPSGQRAAVAASKMKKSVAVVESRSVVGGVCVNTASIDMKKAIRDIQAILNKNGFDAGAPDGAMGDKTVAALKSFQKSVGLPADGRVTDQVVKELLARNK